MSQSDTTTGKVIDKLSGALEKLVDIRMLILGLTFLLYIDIWVLSHGQNPTEITLEQGMLSLRHVSMFSFIFFFTSYSLLMVVTFPTLRTTYRAVWMYFFEDAHLCEGRSSEERKTSDWSFGFIALAIWDSVQGFFYSKNNYLGVVNYFIDVMVGDGIAMMTLRLSAFVFATFCLGSALERDTY
ncbi:hypothetical protein [Chromobacterium violaceum]|uniref:hypothetical protein n=1 Tax=Chromobacterium violaceum TaxID=536 RepID=UPI00111C6833|nr:hypothetical protein [Chromobacterium violaceum]